MDFTGKSFINEGNDLFSNSDDDLETGKERQTKLVISSLPTATNAAVTSSSSVSTVVKTSDVDDLQAQLQSTRSDKFDKQLDDVSNNFNIKISIRSYDKRGEGINAYIVYKIETKVSNVPGYTKNYFEVWRRFSDFLGLREKLVSKYQSKGIIIPYAPEKSISTLTKTKLNSSDENSANELAEKRSRLLKRFLCHLAAHPRLVADCDVRDFLSFDGILPKSDFTAMLSSSSMKKMFKSLGETFTKIATPMDENDRWFEQINNHVDELEEIFGRLNLLSDGLFNYRRELSISGEHLCKALSMLASCEENTALARALAKLAETHENIALIERRESKQDCQQLVEEFHEQLQLIYVLKEVFYERVKGWQNWQNQQHVLTKKREIKTRLDLSGKVDKAAQYKDELKEQENNADKMEREFLETSKTIREEYNRYRKQCRDDIKQALISYLESVLENEQQILECWEKLETETKDL